MGDSAVHGLRAERTKDGYTAEIIFDV